MSEYDATAGFVTDDRGERLWSILPSVVDSPHNSRTESSEVFSPAVTVCALEDEADVVRLANDQQMGGTLTKHPSAIQAGWPASPSWVPPCRENARVTARPPATSRSDGERLGQVPLLAPLSCREEAILRAVHAGRVEISCSSEPDMFIDGINCCHQATARRMFHKGWVQPAHAGRVTERVRAVLTAAGRSAARLAPPPQPRPAVEQTSNSYPAPHETMRPAA